MWLLLPLYNKRSLQTDNLIDS